MLVPWLACKCDLLCRRFCLQFNLTLSNYFRVRNTAEESERVFRDSVTALVLTYDPSKTKYCCDRVFLWVRFESKAALPRLRQGCAETLSIGEGGCLTN